jgi:hypothetical protein
LYFSHLKGFQNIALFHKENPNASVEEMKYVASTNGNSLEEILGVAVGEVDSILRELQTTIFIQ